MVTAFTNEFQEQGHRGASELPTGLLQPPGQRELFERIMEVLGVTDVFLRRKLRAAVDLYDARRTPAFMLPWLLANVGLDAAIPLSASVDDAGRRGLAAFAPVLTKTRGSRKGLRQAARLSGPRPIGIFDWFAYRTVSDVTALPFMVVDDPAGRWNTDIHVADPQLTVNRPKLEALVRVQLAMGEQATIYYVRAFDDGATGTWQWTDSGKFLSVPTPAAPYLALKSTAAGVTPYLSQPSPYVYAWTSYSARWAFEVTELGVVRLWAYYLPSTPVGYQLLFDFTVPDGVNVELSGKTGFLNSASVTLRPNVTYLVQMDLATGAFGTAIQVSVDGAVILAATEAAPNHYAMGTIAIGTDVPTNLYLAEAFVTPSNSVLVTHFSVLK